MSQAIVTTRLVELEQTIERGLTTFVEVGLALLEIRDSRLYRQTHGTFEEYCRERWGWKRGYADHQIRAAQIATIVAIPPKNEAQARELARLDDPNEIRDVWHEVRAEHGDDVTAKDIRQAVDERRAPKIRIEHACTTCGEIFDHPVWHCDGCDQHWPMTQRACPECGPDEPPPSQPIIEAVPPLPPSPRIDLLQQASDRLKAATALGRDDDMIRRRAMSLARELDRLILDARRARGERV